LIPTTCSRSWSARQDADVELIALSGEPITRTATDVERSWSGALTASVTIAGVTVATLVLYP
jgi:hypothetical protein